MMKTEENNLTMTESKMKTEERSLEMLENNQTMTESMVKTAERSLEKLMKNPTKNVIFEYDGLFYRPGKLGSTNRTAVSVDYFTEFKSLPFPLRPVVLHQNFTYLDDYRKPFSNPSVTESGQSSNSENDDGRPFICEICFESRAANDSFNIERCFHSYCKSCIAKYVESKLEDNITSVLCPVPQCCGLLKPEYCRSILPQDVFDRWGNLLRKAVILQAQNFQELCKAEGSIEDIMLMKLAQEKKWRRCPHCNYFVEKISGCRSISCRCGCAFCYSCGSPFILNSFGCSDCYQPFLGVTILKHIPNWSE